MGKNMLQYAMRFSALLPALVAVTVWARAGDASLTLTPVKIVREPAAVTKSSPVSVIMPAPKGSHDDSAKAPKGADQQTLVEAVALMDTRGRRLPVTN